MSNEAGRFFNFLFFLGGRPRRTAAQAPPAKTPGPHPRRLACTHPQSKHVAHPPPGTLVMRRSVRPSYVGTAPGAPAAGVGPPLAPSQVRAPTAPRLCRLTVFVWLYSVSKLHELSYMASRFFRSRFPPGSLTTSLPLLAFGARWPPCVLRNKHVRAAQRSTSSAGRNTDSSMSNSASTPRAQYKTRCALGTGHISHNTRAHLPQNVLW
jgi:hypothetical protein